MIIIAGGVLRDPRNPANAPIVVGSPEARLMGWRDFRGGLIRTEEELFLSPAEAGGTPGRIRLSDAGRDRVVRIRRGEQVRMNSFTRSVLLAAASPRWIYALPCPVFQGAVPQQDWATGIAIRNNPGGSVFRPVVDTYGQAADEFLGFEVMGRTDFVNSANRVAFTYVTHRPDQPLNPAVEPAFHTRTNATSTRAMSSTSAGVYGGTVVPAARGVSGRRPGDTAIVWLRRESVVSFFHELLIHAVWNLSDPDPNPQPTAARQRAELRLQNLRNWVERRARNSYEAEAEEQ